MNITQIQKLSKTNKFISVFGKSTVDQDSPEYKLTEQITKTILSNNYGVIHGGYTGGIMQAVADTAFNYLKSHGLPTERNIAIPQREHDLVGWKRVSNAVFTKPSKNIYERLEMITNHCDYAVVGPLGGDGTLLEIATIFHNNSIAKHTGAKIIPLIFIQTKDGTDWKSIIQNLYTKLDINKDKIGIDTITWVHFMTDTSEIKKIIQ